MAAAGTVVVGSSSGLHARPASALAQAVGASGCEVTIGTAQGRTADAVSLLELMALGVRHGDRVTLTVSGPEEHGVLEELTHLLGSDLDAR